MTDGAGEDMIYGAGRGGESKGERRGGPTERS